MEPCFPGDGWARACQWEVVNKFLVLLCLCAHLFLYLLNCLYPNPQVFSLLSFWFSPPSHRGEVSKWMSGAQLTAEVKPWHFSNRFLTYFASLSCQFANQKLRWCFAAKFVCSQGQIILLTESRGVNLGIAFQDSYKCFLFTFGWCRLVFLLLLHLMFCFEFHHQNNLRSQNENQWKPEVTRISHWILTCMWFSGRIHLTFTQKMICRQPTA